MVESDGASVAVGPPKQRTLLAALLVSPGHVVSTEPLIDELWPDEPPATAVAALQVHVAGVRKLLGHRLRTVGSGYVIDASTDDVDAGRFVGLLARARSERPDDAGGAVLRYRLALEQWRGAAFENVRGGPRILAAAARLERLRVDARDELAELELSLGRHREIVADLSAWVVEHDGEERLVARLMIALHRSGRSAEAIEAYDRLHARLERDGSLLDGPAGHVATAIHRGDPTIDPVHPHLPVAASRFIGRRRELDNAARLLSGCRLLTVIGTGGCGKTRFAVALAKEVAAEYPDDVWMVDLAGHPSAGSATALAARVGAALALRVLPGQSTLDSLVAGIASRRMLVVVDNCEHVLQACAAVLGEVLARSPGVRVVATSREPLGLDGETTVALGGLRMADLAAPRESALRSDAYRLFAERVRQARGGVALGAEEEPSAVELCRRLDGLPLAIELAAARMRGLTLPDIAVRLDRSLDLLIGRSPLSRHRTMRAAIDWSYDLLEPAERALLRRLSVFVGHVELAAVETVGADADRDKPRDPADVLDLLTRLVDRSMVSCDAGASPYRLIETMREYARERLGDREEYAAARCRHAEWCADLVAVAPPMDGPAHAAWLAKMRGQHDNVRAALGWTLGDGKDPDLALAIATSMWWYWWVTGQMAEGLGWLARAIAAGDPAPTAARGRALRAAAALARNSGDLTEARRLGEEALRTMRAIDDRTGVVMALNNLCITAQGQQDYDASLTFGLEAIERAEADGPPRLVAAAFNNTAGTLRCLDRLDEASTMFGGALERFQELADGRGEAAALTNLAVVARRRGEWDEARRLARQFLALYRDLEIAEGQLDGIEALAHVYSATGDHARALRLLALTQRERDRLGAPLFTPDEIADRYCAEAAARAGLSGAAAAAAVAGAAADDLAGVVRSLLD